LYTDGFADQFGGPSGKKLKRKRLNEMLKENATLPLNDQKDKLHTTLINWKGNLEQVDDVCVIGVKL
ncbi:MAG: SpoIIE family protein phosphatase, partial [Bacteroidetes bacterium]|nr:SpoIIE family protein phosphatase [Bacteroidota bacterium]